MFSLNKKGVSNLFIIGCLFLFFFESGSIYKKIIELPMEFLKKLNSIKNFNINIK